LKSGPEGANGVTERVWATQWSNDSTRDTITLQVVCADRGALHQ
jgi:hypothetical protein